MRQTVFIISVFTLIALCITESSAQPVIRIAAASDLKFALDSILFRYAKEFGTKPPQVTYGSSGKLYEQISNGAPFHVFFSADMVYPTRLKALGLTVSDVIVYGKGRLVLWTRSSKPPANLMILSDKTIKKIAIANPRHAPYGQRAVEVLKHHGVYEKVVSKLVMGENISQAAQFVYSGAADAGIIALSLALAPTMQNEGSFFLIPEETHTPLEQGYVVLKSRDNPNLENFITFLQSAHAHAIFVHFGFRPGKV